MCCCADARKDIISQFRQHNGKLVAFALASGACFTFADVFLQQALPLVGLVTAAAISNALRIIISVLTNYYLDGRLDNGAVLFPGLALALLAIISSTAAQLWHRNVETGSFPLLRQASYAQYVARIYIGIQQHPARA